MRKFLILLISICLFSSCSSYSGDVSGELISLSINSSVEDVANKVTPAIVGVCGMKGSSQSLGSGVCVAPNGYIVTNSHVINDCSDIVLYLSNNSTAKAKVVFEDTVLDFAIIKSDKAMPYLKLSEEDISVGKDVLAIGTPLSLNLTHTVTKGIISAINRTIKINLSGGEGYMQNLIQHDASLNPGNSGGPLINMKGEIIGINTLKINGGEGIGFAIPVKSFRSLLNNYVKDEDYEKPYLGVYGIDSEIAVFNNLTNINSGFYVIDVAKGSPLQLAGVSSDMVITKVNNKPIKNSLDFKEELYKLAKGDNVHLEYIKNGVLKRVTVVV